MSEQQSFEHWCIVELMGHQRMAGYVTEATIAGGAFIRIDVPAVNGKDGFTRHINPSAIYALNPCDEETAKTAAKMFQPKPVTAWEMREQLALDKEPATASDNGDDFSEGPPY